jgi:putative transposase
MERFSKRVKRSSQTGYLDARYKRVRQGRIVQKAAALIAVGVDESGKRSILGVSVALSEHEVQWRTFLQSLVAYGLGEVRLIVSDAHEGLKAARLAVFGSVPWQRCQFHLPLSETTPIKTRLTN